MKKSDFIDRVAEKAEMSKTAAARAVSAIFDATSGAIAEAMKAGENISLPGFGKFKPKRRAARKGRNPRTGKEITIPERTVVAFSSGKGLSDTMAGRARPRKNTAKKSTPKKTTMKKSTAKKSPAKKSTAKKSPAKKTTAERSTAKKSTAKKSTAKKSTAKKSGGTTARKSTQGGGGARKSTAKKGSTAKK